MPKKSFHFEIHSVHGHLDDHPVDYLKLVGALTRLRGYHEENNNYHVVVGRAELKADQLFLVIYTGYSEKNTLFFDWSSNAELTEVTLPGRFKARKTHAIIDASKRLLGIEVRKGALGSLALSALIEQFARTTEEFKTLEIDFNPVADLEFANRLNQFRRIQAATITIARPNVDWTDRHDQLTDVAKESDAASLDLTARAKRGKSLSKESGLIQFIRLGASSARTMFKKIKITGAIGEDSGLIQLDLSKHVEHVNIALDVNADTGLPNESEVRSKLSSFLGGMKAGDGEL
jgi:hypothetical protein